MSNIDKEKYLKLKKNIDSAKFLGFYDDRSTYKICGSGHNEAQAGYDIDLIPSLMTKELKIELEKYFDVLLNHKREETLKEFKKEFEDILREVCDE